MKRSKEALIQELNNGAEVVLIGEFNDGETEWAYEYWQLTPGKSYKCSYDGEWSHYFQAEDLQYSFRPEQAEEIEINEQ